MMAGAWNEDPTWQKIKNDFVSTKQGKGEMEDIYQNWAETYDKDLNELKYGAPSLAAEYLAKHAANCEIKRDAPILDVGAGTGLVGDLLFNKYSFTTIDAVDGSDKMLQEAEKLGVYEKLITSWIGGEHKMPIDDRCYAAVVMAGVMGPNHITEDALPEIIRVIKPGGLFVNVIRHENTLPGKPLADLKQFCLQSQSNGLWECVVEEIPEHKKYYMDCDAFVMVYQVC